MIHTLFEALLLVVVVVLLFLQTWRAALIPMIAIPVSLIGTFAVMAAVGFSFNNLSLFGLVLAIGIVVDDAIVVVENVERYIEQGMSPQRSGAQDDGRGRRRADRDRAGAVRGVRADRLHHRPQGTFFKQFAITIAASTVISAFVSLTLSPALAALLLKPHALTQDEPRKPTLRDRLRSRSAGSSTQLQPRLRMAVARLRRGSRRRLVRIGRDRAGGLCRAVCPDLQSAGSTPTGLIPQLDRAYLIAALQLPPGSTLERTDAVVRQASEMIMATAGRAERGGVRRLRRRHVHQRAQHRRDLRAAQAVRRARRHRATRTSILADLRGKHVRAARGLRVRARAALGARHRHRRRPQGLRPGPRRARPAGAGGATWALAGAAGQTPGLTQAFTLFSTHDAAVYADIDRTKAEQLGVPIGSVFETLSVYMGSAYVNDFNILGRTYRVTAQADNPVSA